LLKYQLDTKPLWRPIHYLGSKLRFSSVIVDAVEAARRRPGAVLDLFSGSGTIAAALAPHGSVTANDIQEYSRVICSALLSRDRIAESSLAGVYAATTGGFRHELATACEPLLDFELSALADLRRGDLRSIAALQEAAPLALANLPDEGSKLARAVKETRRRLALSGLQDDNRTATLQLFAGTYFSFAQAVDLCALIAYANERGHDRDGLLAPVLSCASDIVNSIGKHFAQFVKVTARDGGLKRHLLPKLLLDKEASVAVIYKKWLERYQELGPPRYEHRVMKGDYRAAIADAASDVAVVYADPPYGREHYSRYYHVLETMSLGDKPDVSESNLEIKHSRGVYRTDRHQSPFCIKSQAPDAFRSLFVGAKEMNASVVLSYSPESITEKTRTRVLSIEEIRNIASQYFAKIDLIVIEEARHSRLNRSDLNSTGQNAAEVLLICED
jgi:adenine-specific DNA-methyltransferase